jgi:hypothetical protein
MRERMSENSEIPEVKSALEEVAAILKEPTFLTQAKKLLETHKIGLLDAFKKTPIQKAELAVCIATAQTLSAQMPEVANRLQIFEMLTSRVDAYEGDLKPHIHNFLGFADEKGQPVEIIDPAFFLLERNTPFLVGSKDEVFPKYAERSHSHSVIPVKVEQMEIIEFMEENPSAINNFTSALQKAA